MNADALRPALDAHGRTQVVAALRQDLDALRQRALQGGLTRAELDAAAVAGRVDAALARATAPRLRAVHNLTGTVLHTNLGRALLPDEAVASVLRALTSPANLEFDLDTGGRGDRDDLVEGLLRELTGAEAATVVNNNAAAVLLMLNALADRREVVVSRGELVEIGGAFRIPDIMKRAGAKLIEVGTTNRTHAADYENAIGPRTAMLMKVHCSNYAVTGFTKSVSVAEVAALAHARGLPATVDLGSGTLVDLAQFGLPKEDTVRETIAAGADLVTFSGDKLLGGPQAGLLVSRADLIRKIKKNPLKRALRVGKLTLAALEPVLALYRAPEFLADRLTTRAALRRWPNDCARAGARGRFRFRGRGRAHVQPDRQRRFAGGPAAQLRAGGAPSRPGRPGRHLDRLEAALRGLPVPVIGRIADDALWLDLRCLEARDEVAFAAQLAEPSCDRRHRGPYRPRQDHAGARPDGRGHRPPQGRKGAAFPSSWAMPTRRWTMATCWASSTCPATKLVHTMAAGASGIDFGLLVVAADDGVMPQTREHLAILSLLGVARGAVALTKADRADAAQLAAARDGIAALTAGTFLDGAPVFELCAAQAGDAGTERLRRHLHEAAQALGQRRDDGLFRLAVDRVFTLAGHGTVVTGTAHAGLARAGDESADLRLMPAGERLRVRGIHAQNRPSETGAAGQRCALNLAGIDKNAIARGDWVADARCFLPSRHVDVELTLLPGGEADAAGAAGTVRAWTPLHVHIGAARHLAHAVPLSAETLAPGQSGWAQLVFDAPVCAMPGDRYIVRNAQATRTVGGGACSIRMRRTASGARRAAAMAALAARCWTARISRRCWNRRRWAWTKPPCSA